jgi:Pectate lyase superfamily protein
MWYNTIVMGDALNMPTIKAHPAFSGPALLDSDRYVFSQNEDYANQNNFYRQVRNLILDTTAQPLATGAGLHWQVAQATSLQNLVFKSRVGGGAANKQYGYLRCLLGHILRSALMRQQNLHGEWFRRLLARPCLLRWWDCFLRWVSGHKSLLKVMLAKMQN